MQGFPKQILGSIEMRDKSCELFTVEVPFRFEYQNLTIMFDSLVFTITILSPVNHSNFIMCTKLTITAAILSIRANAHLTAERWLLLLKLKMQNTQAH
jgi:hypothetical protein